MNRVFSDQLDGAGFEFWYNSNAYISITRNYDCKYSRINKSSHIDTTCYLYKLDMQFFKKNNMFSNNSQKILTFIKNNYQKFSFKDVNNVYFDGKVCLSIKLIQGHNFCPLDSFYLAVGASKIIQMIQSNGLQDMIKKIQNIWGNTYNLSQASSKAAKRAIFVLKGMFSFEQALKGDKYHLNKQVFTQARLIEGQILQNNKQAWIVYHPTSITHQIFKATKYEKVLNAFRSGRNIYIHGQGGIGKSTAFSLLVGLHNFIQDYKLNCVQLLQLAEQEIQYGKNLCNFTKYFYFNLPKRSIEKNQLFDIICHQLPLRLKILALQDEQKQVQRILKAYQENNHNFVLIIDQINILFSIIRRKISRISHTQTQNWFTSICYMFETLPVNLRVIYGSSENAEISLAKHMPQDVQKFRLNFQKQKILHHYKRLQPQILQEIISIIQFQNINLIIKKKEENLYDILELRRSEYQQVLRQFTYQKDNLHGRGKYFQVLQKKRNEKQSKIRNYYQFLCRKKDGRIGEAPLFLEEFTHERVKQYFLKNQQDQTYTLATDENLSGFFQLIEKIYWFMIDQFSGRYRKFMQEKEEKQEKMFEKYRMLTKIRMRAFQASQQMQNSFNQQKNFFQYQITKEMRQQYQFEIIFKDHAEIEENILTIFMAPSTFIKATQFMEKQENFLQIMTRKFVHQFSNQPDWFGKAVETTSINLMYENEVQLQLGGVQSFPKQRIGMLNVDFKFGHYYKMLTSKEKLGVQRVENAQVNISNSIQVRFSRLWDQIDQKDVPIDYFVCAKSFCMEKGKLLQDKQSTNSQAIDFLLIKKTKEKEYKQFEANTSKFVDQQYQIVTFDYCMAFDLQYISQKSRKAQLFFEKFMVIANKEGTKPRLKEALNHFSIFKKRQVKKVSHYIIMPQVMLHKVTTHNGQGFSIENVAVEKMNINILSHKNQSQDIMLLRQNIMKSLLKEVERKSKKV